MKIQISEEQLKKLVEQKISYLPEKIDEFVQQAMQVLEKAQVAKNKHFNFVTSLNLGEVMENRAKYAKMASEINEEHNAFEAKYNKFFDIVDMYDFMDMPNNVKQLEKINDKLYDFSQDVYQLSSALEEMVSAADYLNRLSSK